MNRPPGGAPTRRTARGNGIEGTLIERSGGSGNGACGFVAAMIFRGEAPAMSVIPE